MYYLCKVFFFLGFAILVPVGTRVPGIGGFLMHPNFILNERRNLS